MPSLFSYFKEELADILPRDGHLPVVTGIPSQDIQNKVKRQPQKTTLMLQQNNTEDKLCWVVDTRDEFKRRVFGYVPLEEGLAKYFDNVTHMDINSELLKLHKGSLRTRGKLHSLFKSELYKKHNIDKQKLLEFGNYYSLTTGLTVSYMRNQALETLPWTQQSWLATNMKGARHSSLGSLLKVTYQLDDAVIEELVNFAKKELADNFTIDVITGEDIRLAYSQNSHATRGTLGTLRNSCMRYAHCQDFLDVYCKNSNCSLLVVRNATGIVGRALLWKATDGKTYLDRAYGSGPTQLAIHDYAKAQGYIPFHREGLNVRVQLEEISFKKYPYMDTLFYFAIDEKIITTDRYLKTKKGMKLARYTGGQIG